MAKTSQDNRTSQIQIINASSRKCIVSLIPNVVYKTVHSRSLRLHLLVPEGRKESLPLICWIQGCGFGAFGPQNTFLRLPQLVQFARNGYIVASIEHRLCSEAVFPAQIQDIKTAVRFLKVNAEKYSIDPNRVGVWGNSSGGYLAAFLGTNVRFHDFDTNCDYPSVNSSVQAVVDWYGPIDFLEMNKYPSTIDHDAHDSPESLVMGYPIQEHPELVRQANPITYITENTPPFLIMHGDLDEYVPYHQSELLFQALCRNGHTPVMYKVVGAGHGDGFGDVQFDIVQRFFDRHLHE